MNCLLNAFVTCIVVVAVLSLNVMVLFYVWVGLLLPSPCMFSQSACVFCFTSH